MRRLFATAAALALVALASGCFSFSGSFGAPIPVDYLDRIEPGRTTRGEITAWFGPPSAFARPGLLDLVLASGHLAGGETKRLVARAHELGVRRMVLTHPLWQATELTPDEVRELYVAYGAYTELCFTNLAMHGIDDFSIDDYMEVIEAVGPDGVILSSDCGQTFTPTVADSAREFHELLRQAGVSDDDLELMSVINPNRVLFEDALAAAGRAAATIGL